MLAQQLERAHRGVERLAIPQLRGVRQYELLQHGRLVERQRGALEQDFGKSLGLLEAAAEIHRLDPAHAELVAEPRVTQIGRPVEAGDEKGKCCLVGIGTFGLLAGAQVQPRELVALLARSGRDAEIEMATISNRRSSRCSGVERSRISRPI